jgi:hypothetical protein
MRENLSDHALRRRFKLNPSRRQTTPAWLPFGKSGFVPFSKSSQRKPALAAGRRGLATVIRLRRARCDQRVRALLQGLPDEKLELARLIAAKRKAGLIVALDEQLRPAEFSRKRFQFFNRRRQLGQRKTRERFDSHLLTRSPNMYPFESGRRFSLLGGRNKSILCLIAWHCRGRLLITKTTTTESNI